jgi:DNA transposition AAA+ family ATPase
MADKNTYLYTPKEVTEKLRKLIDDLNFSQNLLSQKIGVSSSVISQIIRGEYEFNPGNSVWMQIEKFLKKIDEKIYDTKVYRVIQRILNRINIEKKIAVITSGSGAGKTKSLEQYCFYNPDAIFIRVNEVFTKKYLLQVIMRSVGAEYHGLNMAQMFESLSDYFTRNQRLFIFDEAERLDVSELELLRDFFDQGNISLCLVGLDTLRTLLKRGKNLRENLVQLYSRVAYQEVVDFLEAGDVKLIFKDRFKGNKISEDLYKSLAKRYEKQGGFRAIINLANIIEKHIEKNKNIKMEINDELVSEFTKLLFV